MSKDAQKAANELKSLVSKFRSILELGEYLDSVGSLDAEAKEAGVRKAVAIKAAEDAESVAKSKSIELDKLKFIILQNEDKAKLIVDNAIKKATEILDSANKKAEELAEFGGLKMKSMQSAIEVKQSELSSVESEIFKKNGELSVINAKIEELKAKLSSFMKG